mgnify:CR=1 FL=1
MQRCFAERSLGVGANALHHRHQSVGALRREVLAEMQAAKLFRRVDAGDLLSRPSRIEREEFLIIAAGAEIAVELGVGVEERLVRQRPLHQSFGAGRDAWRPHRRQRRVRILSGGLYICADNSSARGGPLGQQA